MLDFTSKPDQKPVKRKLAYQMSAYNRHRPSSFFRLKKACKCQKKIKTFGKIKIQVVCHDVVSDERIVQQNVIYRRYAL